MDHVLESYATPWSVQAGDELHWEEGVPAPIQWEFQT